MAPAVEQMNAISRAVSRAGMTAALEQMDSISRAVSRAGMTAALEQMDSISRAVSRAGVLPAVERMNGIALAVSRAGVLPALERMDAIMRAAPGAAALPALDRATAWLDDLEVETVARTADLDALFSDFGEASAFIDAIDLDDFESAFTPEVNREEAEVAEWLGRFVVYYYAAFTAVLVASTVQSHSALKSAVEWMMLASLIYGAIIKRFKPQE